MANSYLIDIGLKDSLEDVVRKANANFRQLAMSQTQQTKATVRQESTRVDAVLDGAVGTINSAVQNAMSDLDSKLDDALDELKSKADKLMRDAEERIEEMLEEAKLDMAPPIGSYLYSDDDPSLGYPGTTWKLVDDLSPIDVPFWRRAA